MNAPVFCLVGPSGVGKDTVIDGLRMRLPDLPIARRVITRPAQGEAHDSITQAAFEQQERAGAFCITWRAHGLCYGIAQSYGAGSFLFNGSRKALPEIRAIFNNLCIISLTARPEILHQRLIARNRETSTQIKDRLQRALLACPTGNDVIEIDNSGPIKDALDQLVALIKIRMDDVK